MSLPAFKLPAIVLSLLVFWLVGMPALATTSAYVVISNDQLLSGAQAEGQIGDLVLENGKIIIIISSLGHVTHYGENGGTVIDAGTQEFRIDALGELYTYFDEDWPRQAVYTSLNITQNGSGGGPAIIRAEGHDIDNPDITVATEYVLADGESFLTLDTWVTGGGSTQPNFELGDAFQWGSCDKYAPGYGFEVYGTTSQAWMAGLSSDVCYAYGGIHGDCWGPNGNLWSDLNVTTETLDPAIPVLYSRFLAVAKGDIASAVSVLYGAMEIPTGSLNCNVVDQDGGDPLAGALVEVFDGSGSAHLQMSSDATGQAMTSLPPGDWQVQASKVGYYPQESWVTIFEGSSTSLDFILERSSGGGGEAIGDTLTVIQRPLVNVPALVTVGQIFEVNCAADPATTGWQAELSFGGITLPLTINQAFFDPTTEWWNLETVVPAVPLFELYDLRVWTDGGLDDTTRNAVQVLDVFKDDYYFIHITDTHLPDHQFSSDGASPADSTETVDLRTVIEDINVINPEFVLITGDFVNEGELEDYLEWRCFTRAQRMLYEFEVPTFLVAGNHDIGGWSSTPPADGTARRDWWRFFGWPILDNPPEGTPWYTQNYSFDYGPVHYVGLEAYNNYDGWREEIYGTDSFTSGQLDWLTQDLAAATSQAEVLFYHKDFQYQLDLSALGVEMALWGHVHSNNGDLQTMPFDISTDNVCDGARSFRLIRVQGHTLQPEPTLSAGSGGQNLRVAYTPSNAGLSSTVTADITNNLPQRFENGRLRFVMPSNGGSYSATGGQIIQIDQSGPHDICYVKVDIAAGGVQAVTLSPANSTFDPDEAPTRLHLAQNYPNPFNPVTQIEYSLPLDGPTRLGVYDLQGHEVLVLVDEVKSAGPHSVWWDGKDSRGREVTSGIYFIRLASQKQVTSRKITLAR